tara:strand:+ start:93 stop:200 length:108 start_codon:yes stop_codon:yes gene_type:complete
MSLQREWIGKALMGVGEMRGGKEERHKGFSGRYLD